MVATAVPVTKPMAPWPGSKELVEAGALFPMIHMSGVNCPQVAEKHRALSSPSLASECLTALPGERTCHGLQSPPIAASGTGGASPRMAKHDAEIGPLSQPPHGLEKQCPLCLPVGPHLFYRVG